MTKSNSQQRAKFLEGSLLRHVVVMSLSASFGLLSLFLVDFVDLYFISLLENPTLTAAVGFAGTIIFFNLSVTIGLMIAMGALAARFIGRGAFDDARSMATSVLTVGVIIGVILGASTAYYAHDLMHMLGARGDALMYGQQYLQIIAPALPLSAIGMVGSGLLRAHGDARRAMNATLISGLVNAVLDPILIFGLGMGLAGAAYASVAARIALLLCAMIPIFRHYGGIAKPVMGKIIKDLGPIFRITIPAILTNIATPVGAIIVTRAIAPYGNDVVAGYSVIARLTPLAFCVVFALSGAVGPIIGQNFGANNFDRVRHTLVRALQFSAAYIIVVWALLMGVYDQLAAIFSLGEQGARLIYCFALVVTPLFFFNGLLFIANASFNNLDRPIWSTALNWGRNTIGTIPFVVWGAELGDAPGVIIGQAVGGVLFGLLALWLAFDLVDRIKKSHRPAPLNTDGDHAAAKVR